MKNKAFTLIELLVVILIIGILAAIALSQYQKAVEKAKAAKTISNIRALAQAEKIYFMTNGKYATSFNDLDLTIPELRGNYITTSDNVIYSLRTFKERNYNYIYGQHSNSDRTKTYAIAYDLDTDTLYCRAGYEGWPAGKLCASLAASNNYITCPWYSTTTGMEKCWAL